MEIGLAALHGRRAPNGRRSSISDGTTLGEFFFSDFNQLLGFLSPVAVHNWSPQTWMGVDKRGLESHLRLPPVGKPEIRQQAGENGLVLTAPVGTVQKRRWRLTIH